MRKSILILLTCMTMQALAQQGKDGTINYTGQSMVNEYATLTNDAAAGSTSIQSSSNTLNDNGRFNQDLAAGDQVLIIQMQGATINTDVTSANWGAVTDYGSAGLFEYAEVEAINPDGSIALTCGLTNSYTVNGSTQIIRVPRLAAATVSAGATITAPAWNGASGGIVAIEVAGDLTLDAGGVIDVSGLGFRGGDIDNDTGFDFENYASSNTADGAEKGESIAGNTADYDGLGGRYGRGAPANGGGGGNNHNAGGGGGANGGIVANWTGFGIPDVSTAAMATAWELELAGLSGSTSSGGGRGGYTWSGFEQDPLTTGPGDASWGNSEFDGDRRRSVGGLGGRPLDTDGGTRIFFGGGGGAGDGNNNMSNAGGNGGGMVLIKATGNIGGTGMILANGEDGEDTPANGIDAPGGAGAGGSIYLETPGTIADIAVIARGGEGGSQDIEPNNAPEAEGPGGGGGGGYVAHTGGTFNVDLAGGANGTTDQDIMADFPQNGATQGSQGITTNIDTWDFTIDDVTVCEGASAVLSPTATGSAPANITWNWFNDPVGGIAIAQGDNYTTDPITTRTSFYVEPCPAKPRQEVIVNVRSSSEFLPTLSACPGDSVLLTASPGKTTYLWSNGDQDQFTYGLAGQTYSIETTDEFGCEAAATTTVGTNSVPEVDILPAEEVCVNHPPFTVVATPIGGGTWSGDGISAVSGTGLEAYFNPNVHYPDGGTSTLYYRIGSGGCSAIDSVEITVTGLPQPVISDLEDFCPGDAPGTIEVLAETGGTWSTLNDGALASTTAASATFDPGFFGIAGGTDQVTYTVGEGYCIVSVSTPVTVLPLPVIESIMPEPLCSSSDPVQLTAEPGNGTWTAMGVSSTGLLDPAISGPGTFNVRYAADKETCPVDTHMVFVVSEIGVELPEDFTICETGLDDFPWITAEVDTTYGALSELRWGRGSYPNLFEVAESIQTDRPDTYSVTAINEYGCSDSTALTVSNKCECIVWTPNAFTPNGDGVNDQFELKGQFTGRFDLWIYNRWGDMLYHTDDPQLFWDGTWKNETVKADVYNYKLICDQDVNKIGKVTVER